MSTISAVYEGGMLRPTTPLDLREGDVVDLTVTKSAPRSLPEAMTYEEWSRRMGAVTSIQEWADLANSCPQEYPDFDVMAEVNKTRRLTGFRLPDPEPVGEGTP